MNKKINLLDEQNIMPYEKYFGKTKQLIKYFKDDDLQVKDNVRTFRALNAIDGYDEVFINEFQEMFGGMSSHISFLFPPGLRAFQNRIGFRFYKNPPLKNKEYSPYFTLVNVGFRKFIILEKDSIIEDADGNSFILESLNCFDIIMSIIRNKINENKFIYPNTIAEILGFIYAAKTLQLKNIIIKDPYYPSPFISQTMKENFNSEDPNKDALLPILYKNHISILLIHYDRNNGIIPTKNYFLIDMSGLHYNAINTDAVFVGLDSIKISKFPNNNIQLGKSCSIWFFSSFLTLIENDIQFPLNNKFLYLIIDKLYFLLNISEADFSTQNLKDKDKDDDNINIIKGTQFLSYKMSLRTFINIEEVMKHIYGFFIIKSNYLKFYQKIFYKMQNILDLYKLNKKYYVKICNKKLFDSDFIENLESIFKASIEVFKHLIQKKKEKFNYIIEGNFKKPLHELKEAIQELEGFIEECDKNFEGNTIKKIYSREEFHDMFFDHEDIYLSMLD